MILPDQLTERLQLLSTDQQGTLLTELKRGIEKENLRIDQDGTLSQQPHPAGVGSALTHPYVTTDFSEALMELITPTFTDINNTLDCLDKIHRFVYPQLKTENLWTASMPCTLKGDDAIPLAHYGSSNVANMKTIYRHGLGKRYGRHMQTIAGIHYNFSFPASFWSLLQQYDKDTRTSKTYITDNYLNLIRNFNRNCWLLVYLYGASPAVCPSFLEGQPHQLQTHKNNSLYLPYATALRMGDLGYQSSAQESLNICYNNIDNYISTLKTAITKPHADYEKIGLKSNGQYQQLSTALLQIENEFYSLIRPKRVTNTTETPLSALQSKGIEYIEVRCIDLNPYLPLGIDADQIRFLDCFLLYNLFQNSAMCDETDRKHIKNNIKQVVNKGRQPGLTLTTNAGERCLVDWGTELMNDIDSVATLLDQTHGGNDYQRVCQAQRAKLLDASLTPSAQILADMNSQNISFFSFTMNQSLRHGEYFRQRPLSEADQTHYNQQTAQSLLKQQDIEKQDNISFDDYLSHYFSQYNTATHEA